MVLAGMWFSKDKPTMNSYLRPIIDEINDLYATGMLFVFVNHFDVELKFLWYKSFCCNLSLYCVPDTCIHSCFRYPGVYPPRAAHSESHAYPVFC